MLPEVSACLEDEVIAAFISGTLEATQVARIDSHLAHCRSCCAVVAAAAAANGVYDDAADWLGASSDALFGDVLKEMVADKGVWATQPAATPAILPGEMLAEKYRVERVLGRGGMGEVFEALHVELGHRVAIKVLRHTASTAATRFLREAQTCARLLSDHIPRVFDLGRLPGGAPYIVMECLSGEDLARVVARGPLTAADAANYVCQACAGLREAHSVGVVHRDLKPANLFLVARKDASALVKVLDFGVSQSTALLGAELSPRLTSTGMVLGSPAYMSPEQIRADGAVDARTDIWALGAVLYELVTGKTPFRAATLSALSVAIATETPATPSSLRPGLPAGFDGVVLRCLEKDRLRRFDSVEALAAALAPFTSAGTSATPRRVHRRGARWRLAGALALGALAATAGVELMRGEQRVTPPEPATVALSRRSVVVVGLRNTSDRRTDTWLGAAIADLLRTELSSGDELRTVSAERVARLKRDLDLRDNDSLERATLTRIRDITDANIALVGSYWRLDDADELRIDVTLQDTASGETLASVAEHGRHSELFTVVSRVGERLRKKLGVEALSETQLAQARRTLPTDPQAQQWYAEGRAQFDRMEYRAATQAFARVVEHEPRFPLGHAMLSEAWGALRHKLEAAQHAQLALQFAADLPRKEQLLVQARAYMWTAQASKAVDICRSLFTVFPDDLDFGLELAKAQKVAYQGDALQATIRELRALPPPMGDDPRIDMAAAYAAQAVSDHEGWAAAAHAAFEKAQARGMRSLQAEAHLSEAQALFFTGRISEAKALFIDARRRSSELGDWGGAASALNLLGQLKATTATESSEEAKADVAEALAVFDRIGDHQSAGFARNVLGNVLFEEARLRASEAEYRRALEAFEEVGAQNGVAIAQANIARVLFLEGDFAAADTVFSDALALADQIGNRRLEAGIQVGLGWVRLLAGQLGPARGQFDAGLATSVEVNHAAGVVPAQTGIAELQRFAGEPSDSRKLLAQAIEGAQKLQDAEALMATSLLQMTLDLDEHQPARVLEQRGEWSKRFGSARGQSSQARAHARFALALLAQNQLADARHEADEAARLVDGSEDVGAVLEVALASARVRATVGHPELEARTLRDLIPASKRAGRPAEYELRLLLGEAEKAGQAPGWRERVRALAEGARQEGLMLYARRAAALLDGS